MTATANRRAIIQHGDDAIPKTTPGALAANVVVKRGQAMLRNASGYVTTTAAAGCTSAGVAWEDADNTGGADGAVSVDLIEGLVDLAIGTSTDVLAESDAPCACYFIDNQTVGKQPASGATVRSRGGLFMGLDPENGQAKVIVGPVGDILARAVGGASGAGGVQAGTVTLVAGTKTVNTGITITSSSKVFVSLNTPGGGTQGVKYKVPDASLVVGGPGTGTFIVTGVDNAGATVATDVSTINYLIVG
jgi:hypothetical protein